MRQLSISGLLSVADGNLTHVFMDPAQVEDHYLKKIQTEHSSKVGTEVMFLNFKFIFANIKAMDSAKNLTIEFDLLKKRINSSLSPSEKANKRHKSSNNEVIVTLSDDDDDEDIQVLSFVMIFYFD